MFIEDLAVQHNISLDFYPRQPGDPDGYSRGRNIYLADDLYTPRRNFVFCHELAHILLGHSERTTRRATDEHEADALAVELILPERDFREQMDTLDFLSLRERYEHASWEVVARRWAQFKPAVLTIFDNEKLTSRTIPPGLAAPPRLSQPEWDAIRETYGGKTGLVSAESIEDGPMLQLQTFFIDDGRGFERVILLTEVSEG